MNNILKLIIVCILVTSWCGCAGNPKEVYTKSHFRSFCGVVEEPTCTDWKEVCHPFEKVFDVDYLDAKECRKACFDMRNSIDFNTKYTCQYMTRRAYGLCTKYCNANYGRDNKNDE